MFWSNHQNQTSLTETTGSTGTQENNFRQFDKNIYSLHISFGGRFNLSTKDFFQSDLVNLELFLAMVTALSNHIES